MCLIKTHGIAGGKTRPIKCRWSFTPRVVNSAIYNSPLTNHISFSCTVLLCLHKGKSARLAMCITLHTWQLCSGSFHGGPLHFLRALGLLPVQHVCYKISFIFAFDTEIEWKEIYDVVACSMSVLLLNSQVSFACPKLPFHVVTKTAFLIILDSPWCVERGIVLT